MTDKERLLQVNNLKKYFYINKNTVLKAVDDISFYINKGETLGMVGESGCGKTTCGRTCMGLYPKTDGQILYKDKDISQMNRKDQKAFTKSAQMIFQDPYASLDPRLKVNSIIAEGMRTHKMTSSKKEEDERVKELMSNVGLSIEHLNRYVHEFSGGQRQRIGIARALALNPEFLVCDEPISALDVSIQAQIVNLLKRLQEDKSLTYLFIAHDLSMVKYISDRISVMYMGCMVELTTSDELYKNPAHPYTKALLSAIPIPDPDVECKRQRLVLQGDVSSPINPPSGCRFYKRCSYATKKCSEETPKLKEVETNHMVACHLY